MCYLFPGGTIKNLQYDRDLLEQNDPSSIPNLIWNFVLQQDFYLQFLQRVRSIYSTNYIKINGSLTLYNSRIYFK